jgi:two-component system C4-dicarboxylate transport sensor histidine kinase DctB
MGSGLGLGLAIVAAIVRDLNGTIEAKTSSLGGACFRIRLPSTHKPVINNHNNKQNNQ